MPQKITTDGIIIKETNIGEFDKVVTVLTRELGIIRAFVTNARKITNKNFSASGLLCYGTYTFYETRDAYRISESEPREMFFELRQDIEKLAVAQYLCEVCSYYAPKEESAEDFLRLILNSFHFLSTGKIKPLLIKAITEMRICVLGGYMPDFSGCADCGEYDADNMFLLINKGVIKCGGCYTPSESELSFPLNKTVTAVFRHILYSDFEKLYSFSVPDEYIGNVARISESYIINQTEVKFRTLKFLHSLGI